MGERLGTNRGFELGDVTQFTSSGTDLISFATGTTNVVHDGTYGGLGRNSGTSNAWNGASKTFTFVLTTQAFTCQAGAQVTASFWQRIYQDTLPTDGRWGTRTMAMVVNWYDSGDNLLTPSSVATGFPTATYGEKTGSAVTAPATTTYGKLKVTYTIPYYVVEPSEGKTFNHYIAVDDFSISITTGGNQVIWWL